MGIFGRLHCWCDGNPLCRACNPLSHVDVAPVHDRCTVCGFAIDPREEDRSLDGCPDARCRCEKPSPPGAISFTLTVRQYTDEEVREALDIALAGLPDDED
jgi:hypothetical protein